jgi:pimeloyl-ACP methyl ester carboxylesterase
MTKPAPPSTCVLLRGLARGSGHWDSFPDVLQARLPGVKVLCLDLPGNGELHRERSPSDVAAMTEHLRGQLQARGGVGPVLLLALSLGAMVAIDWAQRYPGEVSGAVLINTSLRRFSPPWQRLQPEAAWSLLGLLLRPHPPWLREQTVLRLTTRLLGPAPTLLQHWTRLAELAPITRANVARQLWAALRFAPPLGAPPVPLLLLVGGGDQLAHPACSRALAEHWQLPLRLHPQAGHDLPLDAPMWVAQQVHDWLAWPQPA